MSWNAAVQYLWLSSASVISDTVDLFNSGMFLSETKLVIRYGPLSVEEWLKSCIRLLWFRDYICRTEINLFQLYAGLRQILIIY